MKNIREENCCSIASCRLELAPAAGYFVIIVDVCWWMVDGNWCILGYAEYLLLLCIYCCSPGSPGDKT